MDDFVRDKLTEWGLRELIETFTEQKIDRKSLYCLEDQDIVELIPLVGPRSVFKTELKLLKEQNTANPDTSHASAQVIPSTSGRRNDGKRKSDLQGESNQQQSPTKKQRLAKEEIILADVKEIMGCVLKKIPPRGNNLNNFLRRKIHDLETDKREVVGVFGKTGAGKSSLINAVIGLKKFLPSGSVSACTSVSIKDEELSEKFIRYTRTKPDDAEDEGTTRWYWPLVKCVTIKLPNADLLKHVTLVDLPGNGDTNKSTDKIWKTVVGSCSTIWIVADINRAASDKEAWDILKDACSYMGNGGQCNQIHFICTKSDPHQDSEDTSKAGIRDFILKRNQQAKAKVKQEFNQLNEVKKHFSNESFEHGFKVFTVSSVEFLNPKHLNKEQTEIPKLQEFLQELNDCHRETLNYVSGARGILSLIQGASHRGRSEIKKDVCTILEEKMTDELEKVHNQMEETYQAFENCLSAGVETSESYCERALESVINPRKPGGGFHKTLRCLVEHNGIHNAGRKKNQKKKKQINLNMALSSYLTESIDEKFKETFPNEVHCGPFNGKLNSFSLDTKTMKMDPEYKDVELQLEFLNAEEVKMKKKLVKIIRERKKTIYSSLMTTVEESMQKCYDDAKEIRGANSLRNMREMMKKRVQDSKNIMFKHAKKVMLNQLRSLMDDILKDLKETMQESIELSLKTDGYSIPDVAEELNMVKNHYKGLKGSAEDQ